MTDFEDFIHRTPDSLTDTEKLRLGVSHFDASRREDQQIAEMLGVTGGDAIKAALKIIRSGGSLSDLYKTPVAETKTTSTKEG